MQIVRDAVNQELLSEVALRCNDTEFRDFADHVYAQASYREEREIAREYSILEKCFTVKVDNDQEPIILPLPNFKAEYKVEVNGKEYHKVNELIIIDNAEKLEELRQYTIRYFENQLSFDYLRRAKGDKISIYYISLGNTGEEYDGTVLIPNKYYEELLRRVCVHMAKLGVAKFTGEKNKKYQTIYQLYSNLNKNANLAVDSQWIQIKPFRYP